MTEAITEIVEKDIKPEDIRLDKELLYDKHTLKDTYPYKDTTRQFQWDKIKERLALLENIQLQPSPGPFSRITKTEMEKHHL